MCGSVAVDRQGARLGKGAGHSDIEVALLKEAGLIGPWTTIATTGARSSAGLIWDSLSLEKGRGDTRARRTSTTSTYAVSGAAPSGILPIDRQSSTEDDHRCRQLTHAGKGRSRRMSASTDQYRQGWTTDQTVLGVDL